MKEPNLYQCTMKRRQGKEWTLYLEAPSITAAANRLRSVPVRNFSKLVKIELVK